MTEANLPPALQDVDLTNCDREPIHLLGKVQSFGCLIVVSSDWIIVHASQNTQEILNLKESDLIGLPFTEFIPGESVHLLRTHMQTHTVQTGPARIFAYPVFDDDRLFDISIHRSGTTILVEFENHQPSRLERHENDYVATVQALIERMKRHDTVERMAVEAAKGLKLLTGFDRVMVYRFEQDNSGSVIAEAASPGLEPYLGLRYPASDIPKQARQLYTRSVLRIIADVDDATVPVVPHVRPNGEPVDLSLAVTRAVSEIHLEYLRNMGVAASMSVSILKEGKLWGLFACHHYSPYYLGFEKRSAIELFAQLFNYELTQVELRHHLNEAERARALHDRLMSLVSDGGDLLDSFEILAPEIEDVIQCDGIAIYSNGVFRARGRTPTQDEFLGLARFLNTAPTSQVFATDNLGALYPAAEAFADRAAGVLALPISRTPRDYLVLFRREITQTVHWAGNPDKPVDVGPHGSRLTPRKSFELWQETVRGHCAAWETGEVRAAEALRVTLLEVVLKLSDEANVQRKQAQERQELLIAELNHRVRNILSLIRALVSQSREGMRTIEDYSETLDARVNALSRAHDQLTESEWGWTSLRNLIGNEIEAFLSGKSERVILNGDDIDLSPTAFTTLALVIHELVTNSAKYGALSDSAGTVQIDVALDETGNASLAWRERGGPAVQMPKRKGFGSLIIERSVRHELKGDANIQYKVTGFEAQYMLPAAHITRSASPLPQVRESVAAKPEEFSITGEVLVVEDNLIIMMDLIDMLEGLGASQVHSASGVTHALQLLNENEIRLAVIDINLGEENSIPIIEKCVERGINTIMATGYGTNEELFAQFPTVPVLRKPYTSEDLVQRISQA